MTESLCEDLDLKSRKVQKVEDYSILFQYNMSVLTNTIWHHLQQGQRGGIRRWSQERATRAHCLLTTACIQTTARKLSTTLGKLDQIGQIHGTQPCTAFVTLCDPDEQGTSGNQIWRHPLHDECTTCSLHSSKSSLHSPPQLRTGVTHLQLSWGTGSCLLSPAGHLFRMWWSLCFANVLVLPLSLQ